MNVSRLLPLLVALLVIYFAFQIHWLLGLIVVVAALGYAVWTSRATVYANKAHEASNQGDMKKAVQLIEEAVRLNRKQPAIMASYAYLLLKDGQIEKAEEAIETVRKMDGADNLKTSIVITHALIRWKQGRLDEAIDMLEELHGQLQNTLLYGSLGHFYVEKGDLDKALAYNLEAFDYNDTDGVILDNLVITRILRGEWQEAEEAVDKLMELRPKFPEAYYHRALIKEHKGDLEGALEDCEEALGRHFTAVSTVTREAIMAKRDELAKRLGKDGARGNGHGPNDAGQADGQQDASEQDGGTDADD